MHFNLQQKHLVFVDSFDCNPEDDNFQQNFTFIKAVTIDLDWLNSLHLIFKFLQLMFI